MDHSRGPWTVRKNFGDHWGMREVIGPALCIIGFTSATDVDDETRGRIEADGRLIAAAPDLLLALKCMEEEMSDYMRINNLGDPGEKHNIRLARAAIERATGGQP